MHERFRHDRISGKLADPNMLWSQEFPKWLQRLSGRREHVRDITGFGGGDFLDIQMKSKMPVA